MLPVKSETPSTAAPVHESTIAKNVDDVAELTSADTLVSAIVEKPQSHSHHRPATARARIPVPSSNPVPSSKHDVEAEPTAEPTSRSVDTIIRDASASDWSKRMQAFEELSVHLTSSSPDLATNMTVPIYDAIISGLGDPHFRVVRSVLACTELCLKADGLPVKYHDLMLPALLNVCEDPQIKSKPEIAASAASCLQALCSSVKPEQLVHSLLQVLNAPDFRQNVRIRQGCIVRLAATVEHAAGYFSKVSSMVLREAGHCCLCSLLMPALFLTLSQSRARPCHAWWPMTLTKQANHFFAPSSWPYTGLAIACSLTQLPHSRLPSASASVM